MNTITKILGKDISSIIFQYLTMSKNSIKHEYVKNVKYFKNVFEYFDLDWNNKFLWKIKNYKSDNYYMNKNCKYDGNKWIYV